MRQIRLRTLITGLALLVLARPAAAAGCDVPAASSWIQPWLDAWQLTSREILRLPDAPAPHIVFFDSTCIYTTYPASAPQAREVEGPALLGKPLRWRASEHGDSLVLPEGRSMPVTLLSFASADRVTGPYFVMAAPSYWRQKGHGQEPGLTGVFLHEFAHTRQVRGMAAVIGPIDATWKGERELDDDAVQHRFGKDSVYVKAYLEERDLLHRAALADSLADVRVLAAQALEAMKRRHARWFTGADSVYATLDDTFLSMEGAGQWVAVAWLSHPKGGGMTRAAAVERMLGRGRWWTQDEGLALFLVVDRLLPGWPALVFGERSFGATELLERALAPR